MILPNEIFLVKPYVQLGDAPALLTMEQLVSWAPATLLTSAP